MRGPNPKKHLAFSRLEAESLLRVSEVVCVLLEEGGAVPRSGIAFKTFRILTQWIFSYLQSLVKGSLQPTEKGCYS